MESRIRSLTPVIPVLDVAETLSWYGQRLGASALWSWGDPAEHGGCTLGGAAIQFGLDPDLAPQIAGLCYRLNVANIMGLRDQLRERGTPVAEEPSLKPWGAHEFLVIDLNGIELRFSEFGLATQPAREPLSAKIENRPLSSAEKKSLYASVGWENYLATDESAEHPMNFTAVAILNDQVIGAASVSGNGVNCLAIRDVMVRPEFQHRGVATQLMESVMAWTRTEIPKGVYLTLLTPTGTTAFYERFGFLGPDHGLVGMYMRT